MNREKCLNKPDRKKRSCLNDYALQYVDDGHTASQARQNFQHQLLERSVYESYRLDSDQLNAEIDSVPRCDMLTFHNQKAGGSPSKLYQGRTVDNVEVCQRHQNLVSRKKKKKKNCGLCYIHTGTAVPVSTEGGAAGLVVNQQIRSTGRSSGWQGHSDVQRSQPYTLQNESFSTVDLFLSPATVTATVATTQKVCTIAMSLTVFILIFKIGNVCIFLLH